MADGAAKSGFSLSLGGGRKRVVDVQGDRDAPVREQVLGFGTDGGLQTAEGAGPKRGPLSIAKQENSYKAGSKYMPSFIPEASDKVDTEGIDKFETAAHDTAVAQQDVQYGLLLRSRPQENGGGQREQRDGQPASVPADRDAAKLKEDLEDLPPEADLDAYAAMPVDHFGMALLRGMGWTEGRGLGRNAKEEVKAKELLRRPDRLGLGAAPAPAQANTKKYIKPGESRERADLVYVDSQGVQRHSKPVDEKLVERRREGVHAGKVMRVVDGRHSGLLCEVVALEPLQEGRSDRARVRLLPSYESVTVRCRELGEKGEMEQQQRPSSRGGEGERDRTQENGGKRGSEHGNGREADRHTKDSKRQRQRDASPPPQPEATPWLMPNIRVKIVDKQAKGGKLYLKKGTVVDVKTPVVCDVYVDDIKESVLDVLQRQLETVVPATEGTPVLVLAGPMRGKQGKLMARNTESGMAAVQLLGDLSVHKFSLDDVSEYTGPTDAWGAE